MTFLHCKCLLVTELNLTNGANSATLVTWQVKYGRGWLNSHKTVSLAAFLLTYAS
jgi:hypothetical protein